MISCAATVGLGLAATYPLELRRNRWWRIIFSIPVVVLIASVFYELSILGYFALWGFAILGFIWMGPMAHFGSVVLQRLLYGDFQRMSGVVADFGGAKALRKHGDLEDALRHTLAELEKEPSHYEGLLLLIGLYHDQREGAKALEAVQRLFGHAQLTQEQRRFVWQLRKELAQEYSAVTVR